MLSRFAGYVGAMGAEGSLRGERFAGAARRRSTRCSPSWRSAACCMWIRGPARAAAAGVERERGHHDRRSADTAADIDDKLAQLARLAREKGSALGFAGAVRPVTMRSPRRLGERTCRRMGWRWLRSAPWCSRRRPRHERACPTGRMSAPCCSTGTAACSSHGAPICRTRKAPPAAGSCRRAASIQDEDPRAAVLRELAEEIGTDRAEIIGEHPEWLTYDLPPELVGVALGGRYRGQTQRWFALRFTGEDSDIRLDADPDPEFDAWRWAELAELPALAVGSSGRSTGCWRRHSPVSPRRDASSRAWRRCSARLSFAFSAAVRPWRTRFCFAASAACCRCGVFFVRRRLTISPTGSSCIHCATHNGGAGPMGSTIDLKAADGFTLSAYTAGPAGGTKGLVVIQEIFGVNHHMRDMCDRFAAQGYAVCAPALFRSCRERRRAGLHPGGHRQGPRLPHEAERCAGYAGRRGRRRTPSRARSSASSAIASAGRSPGGARRAPISSPRRRAGTAAASPAPRTRRPHCPVQMHFGEKDASIPMTDVEAIRAAQPKAESYVYAGASMASAATSAAASASPTTSWRRQRTLEFFAKLLG